MPKMKIDCSSTDSDSVGIPKTFNSVVHSNVSIRGGVPLYVFGDLFILKSRPLIHAHHGSGGMHKEKFHIFRTVLISDC